MKRTLFLIAFFSMLGIKNFAQQQNPVHWQYTAQKTGDKTYTVHITATIDKGWHIYAQQQPEEAISVPTKVRFSKNPLITLNGKLQETGKKEMQELKEVDIKQYYFKDKVTYTQELQLKANVKTNISGTITYQACTDEMCLPEQTEPFSIAVGGD